MGAGQVKQENETYKTDFMLLNRNYECLFVPYLLFYSTLSSSSAVSFFL